MKSWNTLGRWYTGNRKMTNKIRNNKSIILLYSYKNISRKSTIISFSNRFENFISIINNFFQKINNLIMPFGIDNILSKKVTTRIRHHLINIRKIPTFVFEFFLTL